MKKPNKARLLALLLAATAVIALVASASASAAVWKDGGVEVTSPFKLGLSGAGEYEMEIEKNAFAGIQCAEHMTLSSTGGSNASITEFKNESCMDLGAFSCTVTAVEAIGLPWTVTLGPESETIEGMHIRHKFKGALCPVTEFDKTYDVQFVPDNTAAIKSFEYFASESEYRQFGSYSVEAPNSGTYEIG